MLVYSIFGAIFGKEEGNSVCDCKRKGEEKRIENSIKSYGSDGYGMDTKTKSAFDFKIRFLSTRKVLVLLNITVYSL